MKKTALLALIVSLCISCSKKNDSDTVYFNIGADMKTLDPQLMTDHSGIEIAGSVWEGLTRIGRDGSVVPGVAEKWTVRGNTWTFTLRKDAKWNNGESVTADDFYLAIKRACDPATAAEYAYMMYYIKNAEAFNSKKITDFSQVGVRVINPQTLEIELAKPTAFFASILSFPTYFPAPSKFFPQHTKDYALKANTMLYNGPWKISTWLPGDRVVVEKNDSYWNASNIKLKKIAYLFVRDTSTSINMYKNGQIDITGVAGDKLDQFKGSPELKGFQEGTIAYFEYNVKNKFFANKKIRRALALAINREEYVERIVQGGAVPAYYFVPGVMPGKKGSFRSEYGDKVFSSSESEAKKLLAEGLKEIGHSGPVTIKMLTDNNDRAVKSSQYMQAALKTTLGISIVPETVTFQIRLQRMQSHDFDFCFSLWGPDYMDPLTYMDLWVTNGGNNHTGWGNAAYDAFVRTAQSSGDNSVRMDAMSKAEKLLMEEMPIAPLYVRYNNYVVKSHVKDVVKRSFGQETDFYWASISR